jgi:hypothetical protein
MASANHISNSIKIVSSIRNATNIAINVISYDSNKVCSQCGLDHNTSPTSGCAIEDMISFLDSDRSEEI